MLTKPYRTLTTVALATMMSATAILAGCSSDNKSTPNTTPAPSASSAPTAAPKKEKVDGGEIITAYLGDPQGFIRFWATTTTSTEVIDLTFSYLYKLNEKQELVPDLAVGQPTFSADKKEMTMKIRTDAKWTDGKSVTVDDVVFTYNIPINDDYKGPRKGTFTEVDKVVKVDDTSLKFVFKQPFAGYIDTLIYNILPQHVLKDVPIKDMDKSDFFKKPTVTSGPYKLEEWKSGQFLRFVRNDNFYGGKPAIDKVTAKIVPDANSMMAQLQTGEINVIGVPADQLGAIETFAKNGKIKLQKGIKVSQYSYVAWNLTNPLFQDKKVRQALTTAIDRKGIVDNVAEGLGVVVNSQTPPTYWSYSDNVPKFDFNVEKAKTMLAEAGWKDTNNDGLIDKNGKNFEFELQVNQGNKVREKAVTVIQQQLQKVGIKATPRIIESSAFTKGFQAKQFEAIYYAWSISGDPNPKGIWHSSEIEGGLNTTSYKNAEVDRLIEEDLQTFDNNKRKELLAKIDALIAEDQPYTFLYAPTAVMAYPSNLEGFNPNRDSLKEIDKWYFTK
jgi:peptide/nickel transport system substrate-binding protein